MIRVERIVGNLRAGFALPEGAAIDELWLTRWEAQRRRLRKRSNGGRDVAIALDHAGSLADGDVLYTGDDAAVVVRVDAGEVVVFQLDASVPPAELATNALRLGHVLGNQHWPMRLHTAGDHAAGMELVVPLSLDPLVVAAVIRSHRLEGVTSHFRPAAAGEVFDHAPVPERHANDHAYDHQHHESATAGTPEMSISPGSEHAHVHLQTNGQVVEHSYR